MIDFIKPQLGKFGYYKQQVIAVGKVKNPQIGSRAQYLFCGRQCIPTRSRGTFLIKETFKFPHKNQSSAPACLAFPHLHELYSDTNLHELNVKSHNGLPYSRSWSDFL